MKWFLGRFKYAWLGIRNGLLNDKSILFQFVGGVLAFLAAYLLGCSVWEWLWILLAIFVVFTSEFLNTVTEAVTDLIVDHHYELNVKKAKDVAAGGVLISAIFSVLVGLIIFIPRILAIIR